MSKATVITQNISDILAVAAEQSMKIVSSSSFLSSKFVELKFRSTVKFIQECVNVVWWCRQAGITEQLGSLWQSLRTLKQILCSFQLTTDVYSQADKISSLHDEVQPLAVTARLLLFSVRLPTDLES